MKINKRKAIQIIFIFISVGLLASIGFMFWFQNNKIGNLNGQVKFLEEEIEKRDKEIMEIKGISESDSYGTNLVELDSRVAELEEQVGVDSLNKVAMSDLWTEVSAVNNEVDFANRKIDIMNSQIDILDYNVDCLESDVNSLESRVRFLEW